LTWLPKLKAATKRVIKKACQTFWYKSWPKGDTGHLYRRRYGNGLNKHINKLYAGMLYKKTVAGRWHGSR
jgi:hypothetical protein